MKNEMPYHLSLRYFHLNEWIFLLSLFQDRMGGEWVVDFFK